MAIDLEVLIEIQGKEQLAGFIRGNSVEDASFIYSDEYMQLPDVKAISISLPLQKEAFTVTQTRTFFEGLLPEGFSRKSVAHWLKADEDDYVTILEKLGNECLGAIRICRAGSDEIEASYEALSSKQVCALAAEGATKSTELLMETHLSLTGASGKVGLYYDERDNQWYLPKGKAASTHIVKQSHVRLQQIVLNEQLCMLTAKKIGIDVSDSFIINLSHGEEDKVLFATKRYDRVVVDEKKVEDLCSPLRLHQEDFSQALGIPASKKYERKNESYMERMFRVLNNYSANPIEDRMKLWNMLLFHYFIGNTDSHVKNFSLLYSEDMKSIRLAPAYDIVCTGIYHLTDEMSFYIGGQLQISDMNRETFSAAAKSVGLGEKLAMKEYDYIKQNIISCMEEAAKELYDMGFDEAFDVQKKICDLIKEKCMRDA